MLHPGTTGFNPINHLFNNGNVDIIIASGWLSKHQQDVRPREGKGFLLPDFAEKVACCCQSPLWWNSCERPVM